MWNGVIVMAQYISITEQTVNPNESIVFYASNPCERGLIKHREGTGSFLLSGYVPYNTCGCRNRTAEYLVSFGANVAIPTGGDVEEISVAIEVDGATIPASIMRSTPAAVEEFDSISRSITADIWRGCCETVTVKNTSAQPILVSEAVINFTRPDLYISR